MPLEVDLRSTWRLLLGAAFGILGDQLAPAEYAGGFIFGAIVAIVFFAHGFVSVSGGYVSKLIDLIVGKFESIRPPCGLYKKCPIGRSKF